MATAKKMTIKGISVKSVKDGLWRGGRAWRKEPTELPVSAFTKEQLAQIRAEPILTVTDVEIEATE